MVGDGSAATAMLGLPGFVLLAVSEVEGELEQAVETTATEEFCRSCGRAGGGAWPAAGAGAGPADGGPAGDPDLGQEGLAVRRAAMPKADLDRGKWAHRLAGVAD